MAVESLVTSLLKTWETADRKAFLDAFAADAVFAYPGGRVEKTELGELFDDFQRRKKNVKIYVGPFLVNGAEFVVRYQFACTDQASGKRQAVGTAVRGTLREGKIVLFKEYWDGHIAEEQMRGDLPLDEGVPLYPSPASIVMTAKRIN